MPRAESDKLLEPWLGAGLDLVELPIPRAQSPLHAPGPRTPREAQATSGALRLLLVFCVTESERHGLYQDTA